MKRIKIKIHRGTHQIGGISTEISTDKSRIIIDMGDELSLDPNFKSQPLEIDGVTNSNGKCDGVLFTHYHGDHTGQMTRVRKDVPLYMGALAKEIMLKSATRCRRDTKELCERIKSAIAIEGGAVLSFGDVTVTAYSIDHSACDSYMFLIEAEGKRVLYTGDFRMHGFRGKAIPKILKKIGKVDALITEGTSLSRSNIHVMTEQELQKRVTEYMKEYKYVYVMCSSTNLERICALSRAVPNGKYFVCDKYQYELLEIIEKHWQKYSPLYGNVKKSYYDKNIVKGMKDRGFLMTVRDNSEFRKIIKSFDAQSGIILYSMWDGYRTAQDSAIPEFLKLTGTWAPLHTSGHATAEDIRRLIEITAPQVVIPMHTASPDSIRTLCARGQAVIIADGQEITI